MLLKMFLNMEKICLLVFVFFIHHATAFYRLTEEQYAIMPPLVHTDRFSHCVNRPGGHYCTTYANLVSDKPNPILDMMQNYSNTAVRHYNYSEIVYGLCMTDTCKHYLRGNSTPELMEAAEACLNETLNRKYDLGARVQKLNCYGYKEQKYQKDYIDDLVYNVLYGIVVLNLIGTLYDFVFDKRGQEGWLQSFSLRANWNKLVAPPTKDPKKITLNGINGVRAITTVLVMLGHAPVPPFMTIENPQWLEGAFENVGLQMLFQGHIITQTFFVISGFLLTYNIHLISQTHKLTWSMIPKGVFLRWLRLIPVNLVILALTATWFRFSDYGPFWRENIGSEVDDCRKHWLSVVFYYNNYVDGSFCNAQNWSIACDIHLHIIGLLIVILAPSVKFRNRTILALFVVSVIVPALEVYYRDLDGTFLVVANALRTYMAYVPEFKYTYIPTHTNMASFFMGMYLGYLLHDLQQKQIPPILKKVLGISYWTVFPWMLFVGALPFLLFLGDGPRAPMWARILFALLQKPVFGLLISLIIAGLVLRIEDVRFYSWILESPIWVPVSKFTYSMFATHVMIIRYIGGTRGTISYISLMHTLQEYAGVVVLTSVFGFILYMTVEAPFGQLVKLLFMSGPKSNASLKTKEKENGVHANGNSVHANGKSVQANGNSVHANGNYITNNNNGKFREEQTYVKPMKTE